MNIKNDYNKLIFVIFVVCRSTVKEIEEELAKIDPSREIEIGNYRLDAQGNAIHKKVIINFYISWIIIKTYFYLFI